MFLHGTEPNNTANGRHLHKFIETQYTYLYAKTQFAGSVRCVKIQEAHDFTELNEFPAEVSLKAPNGSTKSATIKVVNETWEVINPGAPWFYLDKYSGNPDAGAGQNIVFTASEENTGTQREATLVIRTSKGNTYPIKVIQRAIGYTGFSVDKLSVELARGTGQASSRSTTVTITNLENLSWTASSEQNWLSTSINGNILTITADRNNGNNATVRYGTVTVRPQGLEPIEISVKQNN